jgi:hypothetical protein
LFDSYFDIDKNEMMKTNESYPPIGGHKANIFWHTVKPFLSQNSTGGQQKIVLMENDVILNDKKDVCQQVSLYNLYGAIVHKLSPRTEFLSDFFLPVWNIFRMDISPVLGLELYLLTELLPFVHTAFTGGQS